MHLLDCRRFDDAASAFLNSPLVRGDPHLLYGEVRYVRKRKHRLPILRAGEIFLAHVNENRDGGL